MSLPTPDEIDAMVENLDDYFEGRTTDTGAGIEKRPAEPGIWPGTSRAEYDRIDAVNFSFLKGYRRTPAHAMFSRRQETDSMLFGTAVHTALLEPDRFATDFVIMPDLASGLCDDKGSPYERPRSTKKYANLVEQFETQHAGKVVVEAADHERCKGICARIEENSTARELLAATGDNEVAVVWVDPVTGLACKGLLDRLVYRWRGLRVVLDLKTTDDVRRFPAKCVDYSYHVQAAFYLWGLSVLNEPANEFLHVVIETDQPYGVAVRKMRDRSLIQGVREFRKYLDAHAKCKAERSWPCYPDGIEEFDIPNYAITEQS